MSKSSNVDKRLITFYFALNAYVDHYKGTIWYLLFFWRLPQYNLVCKKNWVLVNSLLPFWMVLQQWYLLQKTNRERNTIRDRSCTAPEATCTDYTAYIVFTAYTANIVYLAYKVAFMLTSIAILCERYGFICFHAQKKRSGLSGRTVYPLNCYHY